MTRADWLMFYHDHIDPHIQKRNDFVDYKIDLLEKELLQANGKIDILIQLLRDKS